MQIINNDRYLCFSPTQEYSAKACYGIKGMIKVPELGDTDINDFVSKLFTQARATIAKDKVAGDAKRAEYEKVMEQGRGIIGKIKNPKTAAEATEKLNGLAVVLTSKEELKQAMKDRLKELGLKWNAKEAAYEQVSNDTIAA
jgi:hypothetical protein